MNAVETLQADLSQEWLRVRAKNPLYSMRSFAKRLGVVPSVLSQVLAGKRKLTPQMALKLARGMGWDSARAAEVVRSCVDGRSTKREPGSGAVHDPIEAQLLALDQVHIVSEWYYFAVFALLGVSDFSDDPAWIADKLGIRKSEAKQAIERLERVGMIERRADGVWVATHRFFATPTDVADLSLRRGHYQNLELARVSLDRDDVLSRDFSDITVAIDPELLPEAKERIKKFRREFCQFLESGQRKRSVYRMCLQLFPLTRSIDGAGKKNSRAKRK